MDFVGLLVDKGVGIAAALYVVGMIIKKIPHVPNWLIPIILTVLGILAAGFSMSGGFSIHNICQGVFATGAAVLTNQTVKQIKYKNSAGQTDQADQAE